MIKLERSTPSQRKQIALIEKWMNIKFKGSVTSKADCQFFIDDYYEDAVSLQKEYNEL
nr:MAG TPA: hypothetical protein [Caudoviricetes sp.]